AVPSETRVGEDAFGAQLVARGFFEAVNFAFVDAATLQDWGAAEASVPLANPLSAELGVVRTQLRPGLVDALSRNAGPQQPRRRLFEIGKVFHAGEAGAAPRETLRIAAAACGPAKQENWQAGAGVAAGFHHLKGDLESLAAMAGAQLVFQPSAAPHGHP